MPEYSKTQTSILDVAQELAQTRGLNAFSYRDIATRIGVRAPSIHHHFRTKGDLGAAMTARYREDFLARLDGLDEQALDPVARLRAYAELFMQTLEAGRMCLCGTLAVEYETLPPPMQAEVRLFFQENERWLTAVFEGTTASQDTPASDLASAFLFTLEGAMVGVRTLGDARRLRVSVEQFLKGVEKAG